MGRAFLFIGGHRDGARIDSEGNEYVKLPVPCDMDLHVDGPLMPIEFEFYRLERLRGLAAEFAVYVSTSITMDDALRMLIDNYAAKFANLANQMAEQKLTQSEQDAIGL